MANTEEIGTSQNVPAAQEQAQDSQQVSIVQSSFCQ